MAGDFKALRVPIALLHQKVYTSGHRLDKWEGIVYPEPKIEVSFPARATTIFRDPGRVISPGITYHTGEKKYDPLHNLFDEIGFLRKHFFLTDGVSSLMCRYCGEVVVTAEGRWKHTHNCYGHNENIIKRLIASGVCVICKEPIVRANVMIDFSGAPVCCDECLACWDYMEPEAYAMEYVAYKEELKTFRAKNQADGDSE